MPSMQFIPYPIETTRNLVYHSLHEDHIYRLWKKLIDRKLTWFICLIIYAARWCKYEWDVNRWNVNLGNPFNRFFGLLIIFSLCLGISLLLNTPGRSLAMMRLLPILAYLRMGLRIWWWVWLDSQRRSGLKLTQICSFFSHSSRRVGRWISLWFYRQGEANRWTVIASVFSWQRMRQR